MINQLHFIIYYLFFKFETVIKKILNKTLTLYRVNVLFLKKAINAKLVA